jgi:cell wall-associated NlpC family hydrolase
MGLDDIVRARSLGRLGIAPPTGIQDLGIGAPQAPAPPQAPPTIAPGLAGLSSQAAAAAPGMQPLGIPGIPGNPGLDPLAGLIAPYQAPGLFSGPPSMGTSGPQPVGALSSGIPGGPGAPGGSGGFDDFDSADLQALKHVQPGSLKGPGAAVKLAETQIGTPYVFGSTDCSGLTKWVASRLGVELPHSARAQMQVTHPVSPEEAQPGDLVYFDFGRLGPGVADHVMIYAGGGRAIGSQPSTNGVGWYQDITHMPVLGFGRLPGAHAPAPSRPAPRPSSGPRPTGPAPVAQRRRRRGGTSSYQMDARQR